VLSMTIFFNLIFSPVLALYAIGIIYSLLWIPQIVRSARRGSRPGLTKGYLIGSTMGRLFFVLCTS
jgi:transmembrane E3 ubiquitin-protein ligase